MSSFFTTRKPRKRKNPSIEPIKVLHRSIFKSKTYEEYEVVGLQYKVKTKPQLIDSNGNFHYVYDNAGVYLDTQENREKLKTIQEFEQQKQTLNKKIQEIYKEVEEVDVSKLHERILVEEEQS